MDVLRAPRRAAPLPGGAGVTQVSVAETAHCFALEPDETLLAGAMRAGLRLPSDCKSGFCGACRLRVVSGEVIHPEDMPGLSDEDRQCGFALGCQARALTRLAIEVEVLPSDLPAPVLRRATVLRRSDPAPGVTRLWLAVPGAPDVLPGQYLNVILEDGAKRPFSVASAPGSTEIELQIRRIPGGRFTDAILPGLAAGAELQVELPQGAFRLHREDFRPLLLAATGTGIAPVAAILAELAADPSEAPPVSVYWGCRCKADLYLLGELAALGARLDEFELVPVLSSPEPEWQGARGHVQDAVLAVLPDLSEHAVYLCGSVAMIEDARARFLAAGACVNHLYTDGFRFASRG
ncbi:2Fe-2S iron-sulfur cluster-binding protein [Mangrovicoccus sp. HB161399]|uniref:2Fe-2S iron-sulfur cluster-binding protein n=1 Tax=Mangrovicoccus sp. HB161399 TaxID=2720392 RepID=UPI0015522C2D|nr:2Fe-2S iron-sulfur cluster-binding protein [Mangrovicoccus sp. HB161399]